MPEQGIQLGSGPMNDDRGFQATRAETLAIWERNAEKWPSATSPWRPSPGDVAVYRRLASAKVGGRVLVLGTTPELRDLLAELGAVPVLVDMSRAMHRATSRLLRKADPSRETWIEADWCDADLPPSSFDLVLGDMVWWGISVGKQVELCETIHSALNPDGRLIGRIRFAVPTRRLEDPNPVVRTCLARLDAGEDATRIEGELLSFVYDHTADHVRQRIQRDRARALLLELASQPEFVRHAELLSGAASRLVGADWTCQSRDELLAILYRRFEVVQEAGAEDYESSNFPIFVLRKRSDSFPAG
jgi:SAM-dependent methyltransferase